MVVKSMPCRWQGTVKSVLRVCLTHAVCLCPGADVLDRSPPSSTSHTVLCGHARPLAGMMLCSTVRVRRIQSSAPTAKDFHKIVCPYLSPPAIAGITCGDSGRQHGGCPGHGFQDSAVST